MRLRLACWLSVTVLLLGAGPWEASDDGAQVSWVSAPWNPRDEAIERAHIQGLEERARVLLREANELPVKIGDRAHWPEHDALI